MSEKQRRTILYIEDDPASRNLVERMLSFAGYEVRLAATGLEGLDIASKQIPDLILMDINLPDLSGREVTTRLRALDGFADLPIIALTALEQQTEREKALAAGLNGYLTKPIDVIALPDEIEAFLSGRKEALDPETLAEAQAAYSHEVVERLEAKMRELQTAYADLSRLDKMKDAFIQLTAHELRTPLTLIYGYGRLLHDSPVVGRMMLENAEVSDLIGNMMEAIKRMSSVINEILLVGRVASGHIELAVGLCHVAGLVETVMAEYCSAIEQRRLQLRVDVEHAPPQLYADSDLMELAISNLLSNAIKYTPDGGSITLRVAAENDQLLLTVQDNGIGISEEEQPLIFQRFYTAGNTQLHSTSKVAFRGGGLGLGLAVCAGIATAHGGRVWVESPGRDLVSCPGSTFYLTIPLESRIARPVIQPVDVEAIKELIENAENLQSD